MKNPDLPYYLTSFLAKYLPGARNASPNTTGSYAVTFKLLFLFLESEKGIRTDKVKMQMLDHNLIAEYLDWLEKSRNCSITTRNQRLVALHSFYRYVQKQSPENMELIQGILNIPYKKAVRTIVPYLMEDEMKLLLTQPDGRTKEGFRDKVLLSVLYDSAARVQELVDLKIKDVRIRKPPVITLQGKGKKVRQVPIMESTRQLLEAYMDSYSCNCGISKGENHLFVNQKQQPLSRWGISYIINKYVDQVCESSSFHKEFPITPHVFRHSKSMHMLHAGINLIYIRDFLGHVDCSTTEIYARADTEMKRKAIEASCIDILPEKKMPEWTDDSDLMNFLNTISC